MFDEVEVIQISYYMPAGFTQKKPGKPREKDKHKQLAEIMIFEPKKGIPTNLDTLLDIPITSFEILRD